MGSPSRSMRRTSNYVPPSEVPFCPACGARLPNKFINKQYIESGQPNESDSGTPRLLAQSLCSHSKNIRHRGVHALLAGGHASIVGSHP